MLQFNNIHTLPEKPVRPAQKHRNTFQAMFVCSFSEKAESWSKKGHWPAAGPHTETRGSGTFKHHTCFYLYLCLYFIYVLPFVWM